MVARDEAKLIGSVALILSSREIDAKSWWDNFGARNTNSSTEIADTLIQLDYLDAWMDLKYGFDNDFELAKSICSKYLDYPIISWRNKFIDIANEVTQIDETASDDNFSTGQNKTHRSKDLNSDSEGEEGEIEETLKKPSPDTAVLQQQKPRLEASIKGTGIEVNSIQVSEIRISLYKIDLEVLLSDNPTLKLQKLDVGYLRPTECLSIQMERTSEHRHQVVPIPAEFLSHNVFIKLEGEVSSQSGQKLQIVTKNIIYSPKIVNTVFSKNSGQVKVSQLEKSLKSPTIYVKVFAKLKNGNVLFYKDGYCNSKGIFDYVSVNNSNVGNVEKFLILIFNSDNSCSYQKVDPPKIEKS